jgi:acetylglutamate kinase
VVTARPIVLKLGGRALETAAGPDAIAEAIARLAAPVVVVHGGGAEVSRWSERLGLAPRFVEGRRVTDAATLEVATAVLAGLANKRLVAALRAHGVDAVGLAALDGGIATCAPHADSAELGAVGTVESVDAAWLRELVAAGRTPVLASLGAHAGALLNLNADDLAGAVAGALEARALVLLSDTPALVLEGRPVGRLDRAGLAAARQHPDVSGGMIPKLAAAETALAGGAACAWIGAWNGPETLARIVECSGPNAHEGTWIEGRSAATEATHV